MQGILQIKTRRRNARPGKCVFRTPQDFESKARLWDKPLVRRDESMDLTYSFQLQKREWGYLQDRRSMKSMGVAFTLMYSSPPRNIARPCFSCRNNRRTTSFLTLQIDTNLGSRENDPSGMKMRDHVKTNQRCEGRGFGTGHASDGWCRQV